MKRAQRMAKRQQKMKWLEHKRQVCTSWTVHISNWSGITNERKRIDDAEGVQWKHQQHATVWKRDRKFWKRRKNIKKHTRITQLTFSVATPQQLLWYTISSSASAIVRANVNSTKTSAGCMNERLFRDDESKRKSDDVECRRLMRNVSQCFVLPLSTRCSFTFASLTFSAFFSTLSRRWQRQKSYFYFSDFLVDIRINRENSVVSLLYVCQLIMAFGCVCVCK